MDEKILVISFSIVSCFVLVCNSVNKWDQLDAPQDIFLPGRNFLNQCRPRPLLSYSILRKVSMGIKSTNLIKTNLIFSLENNLITHIIIFSKKISQRIKKKSFDCGTFYSMQMYVAESDDTG